jgi:hypothetical protein
MAHTIEPAASGRAKCRGCGQAIAKGELRLGERLPNLFTGEGEMTLWFHLRCGAFKRPQAFLDALADHPDLVPEADALRTAAEQGIAHHRLARVDGAERAASGRARCRECREPIAKDSWRIRLVYFEDVSFSPSGYLHPGCAEAYLGHADLLDRIRCFSPDLDADAMAAVADTIMAGKGSAPRETDEPT